MTTTRFAALSLPHTQPGGTKIDLQWSADATVGVQLDHIRHKTGGNYDFITKLVDPTVTDEDLDGRLWEISYTLRPYGGTEGDGILSPRDATSFEAWDASLAQATTPPAEALLFVWRGIAVPGAIDGDSISVSLLVRLDTDDDVARFWGWITRERGESVSFDHFDYPIVWLKGPALPNGVETHREGQERTRVMTPLAGASPVAGFGQPHEGTNTRMNLWVDAATVRGGFHPAPDWILQCCGIVSVNNVVTPDPAFRRIFYAGTEDTEGWYKWFELRGYSYTVGGADDGYMRYHHRAIPGWRKELGDQRAHDWDHQVATPYPAVLGVVQATGDAVWYDFAAYYRGRTEALGFLPPKIEANARLISSFNRKPSLFMASVELPIFSVRQDSSTHYGDALDLFRALRRACGDQFVSPAPYLEFQGWQLNLTTIENPGFPIGSHPTKRMDDGVREMLDAAAAEGIRCIAYVQAWGVSFDLDRPVLLGAEWRDRSRNPKQRARGVLKQLIDYASPIGDEQFAPIARDTTSIGFAGMYLDAWSGDSGGRGWPIGETTRTLSGFVSSAPRRQMIDRVRDILQNGGRLFPKPDLDVAIQSETAEEFLVGWLDWIGHNHAHGPYMMANAEEAFYGPQTNVPEEARHMSPPYWQIVYHEYAPGQQITYHMGSCALATNTDWQPFAGKPGLTEDDFINAYCSTHAANMAEGMRSATFGLQGCFLRHDPLVTSSPSGTPNTIVHLDERGNLRVDPVKDPTKAGMKVMAFIKTLVQSERRDYAGQFTLFGKLLRPFVVDIFDVNVQTRLNPWRVFDLTTGKVSFSNNRWLGMVPYEMGFVFSSAGQSTVDAMTVTHNMLRIFHSFWKAPTADVWGLVLINWTRAVADWWGTFDPAVYGIGTPYDVHKLVLGGSPTLLASGVGPGAITVGTAASTPTIDVGTLAAHSVTVITFTP